jgi:DNA-binding CsgD family transcriptional regulator
MAENLIIQIDEAIDHYRQNEKWNELFSISPNFIAVLHKLFKFHSDDILIRQQVLQTLIKQIDYFRASKACWLPYLKLANDFLKTISDFGYNELLLKFYTYNICSYYGCYEKLIPKIESFIHKDIKCSKTITSQEFNFLKFKAVRLLAACYRRQTRFDEALTLFDENLKLQRLRPMDSQNIYLYYRFLTEKIFTSLDKGYFNNKGRFSKKHFTVYKQKLEEAESWFSETGEIRQNQWTNLCLGMVCKSLGDLDRSKFVFDNILKEFPTDRLRTRAYTQIAHTYELRRKNKLAKTFVRMAHENSFKSGTISVDRIFIHKLMPKIYSSIHHIASFSDRERECLYYLNQGKTCKEIAKQMDISYRTVEKHIENMKLKTGSSRKTDLLKAAGDLLQFQIEV